ncbi:MAG: HlyD family efflux transporter periplasmic adaptor subunit [Clostridium sp.]|nr:HlyD family efflux transporter periplasmic adaptor subunit [Clostridium sp.]
MRGSMNENTSKRREWVKTAAIIFLSVLLVLTFFSNTFMNYSLPEVAAKYAESGTITAKIRGSGVVESTDPYEVTVKQTRKVSSVAVKEGTQVQKGDVLVYLEDVESAELKAAQDKLKAAQDAYDAKLLTDAVDAGVIKNSQSNISTSNYRLQITNAQNALNNAQKEVEAWQKDYDGLAAESPTNQGNRINAGDQVEAYREAKKQKENADLIVQGAENTVNDIKAKIAEATSNSPEYAALKAKQEKAQTAVDDAKANQKDAESAQKTAESDKKAAESAQKAANKTWEDAQKKLEKAQKELDDIEAKIAEAPSDEELKTEQKTAKKAVDDAKSVLDDAKSVLDDANEALGDANEALNNANAILENANAALNNAQQALNNLETSVVGVSAELENKLKKAQQDLEEAKLSQSNAITSLGWAKQGLDEKKDIANINLEAAKKDLKEKQDALTTLVGDIGTSRELELLKEAIADAQKEVDEQLEKSVDAVIKADIAGTITTINATAGKEVSAAQPVAVIQPEGKGYTMSFSVTKEQAQRLSVGDKADLVNSWRYDNVEVVLASIKPDTTDPAQKKLLTFNVTGDITAGQSLNVSVGQKSATYDTIVPNSAIREDNNGKFVLQVVQKSSPLGNRYIAQRADIEVLASDDTKSAVTGSLESYSFVITTSTKPVEAGQLVRLANEN